MPILVQTHFSSPYQNLSDVIKSQRQKTVRSTKDNNDIRNDQRLVSTSRLSTIRRSLTTERTFLLFLLHALTLAHGQMLRLLAHEQRPFFRMFDAFQLGLNRNIHLVRGQTYNAFGIKTNFDRFRDRNHPLSVIFWSVSTGFPLVKVTCK